MSALFPLPPRSVLVWLAAYFSPTAFIFFLMVADRFHVPSPPEILVVALFILVPVAALAVCESVVWRSRLTRGAKIGWMLFTLVAMALQVGIWLIIIISVIQVMISYV